MKKIIVLALLLLSATIWADLEDAVIVVSSGEVNAGETIMITVSTSELLEEWDVISFQFEMNYDPSAATFDDENCEAGELLTAGGMLIANELEPGYFRVAYSHYLAQSGSGMLVSLPFAGIAGETNLDIHDFKYNATGIENTTDGHITVIGGNMLPVADAGIDMPAIEAVLVTLDGSNSYDPEGEMLTYEWTAPPGIVLSDPTSGNPTFTSPYVTEDTEFSITLVVNDGTHNSLPDEVIVTVLNIVGAADIPALITNVGIYSISPNPFNPSTKISFLVPFDEKNLELKIFSVKGQLVKTMHLTNLQSNSLEQVIWDGVDNEGRAVASGVYFCRIIGSKSQATARMLLLK
ncbi:MAG: T9SS type A sorting domain-containing protein [Candidatus Cloacimonetes bacterium]|nr:T9SS type A sorting domain-containing protein [Candidatus Cloacimonadota bacterium]